LPKLRDASQEDIERLLELFPVSLLKRSWDHLRKTKESLCEDIAHEADLRKIARFVTANFARCKQHSYIVQPRDNDGPDPKVAFPDVHLLGTDGSGREVYLAAAKYTVLLREPFEQVEVELLWPVRFEYRNDALIISFIVFERAVNTLFEREVINVRRHIDEKEIMLGISSLGYKELDLNKGIKTLWREDFMDAYRAKFKKARSTTTEAMDSERGIKATEPELYREMLRLPIFETMFRINSRAASSVEVFQANPTYGFIRMTRYTEGDGDSDEVIQAILEKNR